MALKRRFRGHSRKSSSAGRAFNKGKDAPDTGGSRFGSMRFLKRLFRKAGLHLQGRSNGQAELELLARLGDMEAIQLLADSGYDAKDHLSLGSLAHAAMTGDMDAARLLAGRGISLERRPIFITQTH